MDFTFIEKIEKGAAIYRLYRSTFCRGYYVITAQSKSDFSCMSIKETFEGARKLFCEIAESETDPITLVDIIRDIQLARV